MTPERLDELIQKYVLDYQTESEGEELSGYLKGNGAETARRKLRLALKADAFLEQAAAEVRREVGFDEGASAGQKRRLWIVGGIAAAIAVGLFGWFHNSGTSDSDNESGVATVLRLDGQALVNGQRNLSSGDALLAGDELSMEEGLVELVFRESGVHAMATAPLSLTAQSSESIFLHDGEMKLHVPPQGVGFVVETAERVITDLGTSFVVTAREKSSQVFVLDGQIAVEERNGVPGRLMAEGEIASFGEDGRLKMISDIQNGLPELTLPAMDPSSPSLRGMIVGFEDGMVVPELTLIGETLVAPDLLGERLAPLIKSGFQNRDCLEGLRRGQQLRFSGIAGAYNNFAKRNALEPYSVDGGWLSWYHGNVAPPRPGRYRFWGYADNSLLVAIDGKPVFDGSRYDSAMQLSANVTRKNHLAWPCLIAPAGFASGPWITVGNEPVQLDIIFGEISNTPTAGLLLVEREGETYEETFWGQPKWSLFLTEEPGESQRAELERLRVHMEEKLKGSFSVSREAVWKVRD